MIMATLESTAAVVSGIVIIIVAGLVFIIPQQDAGQLTNIPNIDPTINIPNPPPRPPPPQIIDSVQMPLVELFEYAEGSVVSVRTIRDLPEDEMFGAGSGFVYDTQGHIITNEHVVSDAIKITVTFLDGRSYTANIIGTDGHTDIAVIKAELSSDLLQPLKLGNSSTLRVGESVAAIGNPFGLSGSMTSGIISQLGRLLPTRNTDFSIPGVIQTDAPINPGNSGGPLLNLDGEVIGINTAIQTTTGQFAGIGFAIPSKTILKVVPSLIAKGSYQHVWIGVSGIDISPEIARALELVDARGFLVSEVIDGSPAQKAGIRGTTHNIDIDGVPVAIGGDVILAVDNVDVRKIDDILIHLQREKSVGDMMDLLVLRDGEKRVFTLTLAERPR